MVDENFFLIQLDIKRTAIVARNRRHQSHVIIYNIFILQIARWIDLINLAEHCFEFATGNSRWYPRILMGGIDSANHGLTAPGNKEKKPLPFLDNRILVNKRAFPFKTNRIPRKQFRLNNQIYSPTPSFTYRPCPFYKIIKLPTPRSRRVNNSPCTNCDFLT